MEKSSIKHILKGRFANLPEAKSRIISIFLSSTFTDFYEERNYLIENVYPQLKDFFKREYNLDFQVVDLRWGIEPFGKKFNLASEFCLNEVKTCFDISAKPSFIALLGHRHGSPYLASIIPKNEFLMLKKEIEKNDLKFSFDQLNLDIEDIIDYCYKLDENIMKSDKHAYKLLNMDSISGNMKQMDLEKILNQYESKEPFHFFEVFSKVNSEEINAVLSSLDLKLKNIKEIDEESTKLIISAIREYSELDINKLTNELDNLIHDPNLIKDEKTYLILMKIWFLNFGKNGDKELVENGIANYSESQNKKEHARNKVLSIKEKGNQYEKLILKYIEWILRIYDKLSSKKPIFDFFKYLSVFGYKRLALVENLLENIFRDFDNKELEARLIDNLLWKSIHKKLIKLFQKSATACFEKGFMDKNNYDKYFYSVTEKEIYEGIINEKRKEPWKSSLVFIRSINDSKEKLNVALARKYFELNEDGTINQKKQEHLNKLINDDLPNALKNKSHDNIIKLDPIDWDAEKGVSRSSHPLYFQKLQAEFISQIKNLAESSQSEHISLETQSSNENELAEEILIHSRFANELVLRFQERSELLESISSYLSSDSKTPLILHGISGCGKTSLIAKAASEVLKIDEYYHDNYTIILRFLGTTPTTSTISKTLISIISQLDHLFFKEYLNNQYNDLDSIRLNQLLFDRLKKIEEIYPDQTIFIFIDSIDQLNKLDYNLNWFIKEQPTNTKFVYSTLSDYCNIIEILKHKGLQNECFLQITELDYETALKMFDSLLEKEGRCLANKQQRDAVEGLFKHESTKLYPLYVKLIFDIVKNWCSFTPIPNEFLKCFDINKSIEFIFKSIEEDYGQLLVSRCLFYLTLSDESGISDNELEDVLSLDDELLSYLFKKQEAPIQRFPIMLWNRIRHHLKEYLAFKEVDETQVYSWYHRRFIEIGRKRYVDYIDSSLKNCLTLNMLAVYARIKNEDDYHKRIIDIQPLKFKNGNYNIRKINKILEIIMKIDDTILRNKMLIEQVFLNYEVLLASFQRYFHVSNYCLTYDYIQQTFDLLSYSDSNRKKDDYLITISALIQSICISMSNSLNKYPKSIGTQICSRIHCLYGLSQYYTKFINDYFRLSTNECSLVAYNQLTPLSSAKTRVVHNFFNEIIDFQDLDGSNKISKYVYLYSSTVAFFNWNRDGSKRSELVKEIDLPAQNKQYIILKVFKYRNKESYGIVVATESSIVCLNDNGQEISRPKINNEKIKDIILVGDRGFIVHYESRNYIDIFDTQSGRCLQRYRDSSNSVISFFTHNHAKFWSWNDKVYDSPLFICLFLENSDLLIFEIVCDFESPKDKASIIKLIPIYKYSFQPYKLISGKFGVLQASCKFRLFVTLDSLRFILIEMRLDNSFRIYGIKPNVTNEGSNDFHILSFYDTIVAFQNDKSTHFYNTREKQWFSIPFIYKRVVVDLWNLKNFARIYAYNAEYLDVYLIKFSKDDFKIVNLIKNYHFADQISFAQFPDGLSTVQLKSGCLLDISINSIILSQIQNDAFVRISDKIDNIVVSNDDSSVITYSKHTGNIAEWNLGDSKRILNSQLKSNLNKIDCVIRWKNWIIIKGYDANRQAKLHFYKQTKEEIRETNSYSLNFNDGLFLDRSKKVLYILSFHQTDLEINEFSFNQKNEDWEREKDSKKIQTSSFLEPNPLKNENRKIQCFLTGLNNYFIIIFGNELICLNTYNYSIKFKKQIHHELVSVEVEPSINTDNLIILVNNDLVFYYIIRELDDTPTIIQKRFHRIVEATIEGHLLAVIDEAENQQQLSIFNISEDTLDKEYFKQNFKAGYIKYLNITPDCEYLVIFSGKDKLLRLYRIKDGSCIGELPILSSIVTCMNVTNEYVILGIDDNRILSYLIVDPCQQNHANRIEKFINRKTASFTEGDLRLCLNALVQLFDEYGSYFDWDSLFDENLVPDEDINLKGYLDCDDVFDAILRIIIDKTNKKIFKWQFAMASKLIREKSKIENYKAITVKKLDLPSIHDGNTDTIASEKSSHMCLLS